MYSLSFFPDRSSEIEQQKLYFEDALKIANNAEEKLRLSLASKEAEIELVSTNDLLFT